MNSGQKGNECSPCEMLAKFPNVDLSRLCQTLEPFCCMQGFSEGQIVESPRISARCGEDWTQSSESRRVQQDMTAIERKCTPDGKGRVHLHFPPKIGLRSRLLKPFQRVHQRNASENPRRTEPCH